MSVPFLDPAPLERLGDDTEHYPRKVAAMVNGGTVTGTDLWAGPDRVLMIDIPDAATGDVDRVLPTKLRVIDVWGFKTGGAGGAANTVQVKNGATAITDAISTNIADNVRFTCGTRDDAQQDIAAGGTLRITRTKAGGNAACVVFISFVPVA